MNKTHSAIRPATLAIAACLAFGSTSAFAQEAVSTPAAPASAAPTIVVPPVLPAAPATSATPTFAPTAPVVQATPSVEESKAAAIAASQAEQAAPPQRAEPRSVERSTPAARTVAAPRAEAPAPAPASATPVETTPPVTATPAPEAATPAITSDQATTSAQTEPALYWALGGLALVLAGLGGAALMRRHRGDDPTEPAAMREQVLRAPNPAASVAMTEPAMLRETLRPAATAPAMAMTGEERMLEAMVAAPPSPENPFLTRAKRTRRARLLLARQNVHAPIETPAQAPVRQAAPQPVDRSQAVYDFGKGSVRPSGSFLKPRTS